MLDKSNLHSVDTRLYGNPSVVHMAANVCENLTGKAYQSMTPYSINTGKFSTMTVLAQIKSKIALQRFINIVQDFLNN